MQEYGLREPPEIPGAPPAKPPPTARPLSALQRFAKDDHNELLKFRFLCRTAALLLCGPTGIGKSSFAMQLMLIWALGRDAFGIQPTGALKSLLIQAENDDGDLAEMRDGIIQALKLSDVDAKRACENIYIAREDECSSTIFLTEVVRPLLAEHKPDLLFLDPALSYLGGEMNSQKDVGAFLRNGLNPLLREFNCGCIVVHHTNKPPKGTEKPNWAGGDFAYLGAGSAEWANWPRAVLALRSIGSREIFELQAAKRGGRLNWREKDGTTKAFVKYLAHSKEQDVISWREIDLGEIETVGRPKSFDADEVLGLLPPEGLTAGEWQQAAFKECGVKEATFHRHRRALAKQDRVVKSKVSGRWKPVIKK